MSVPSEAQKSDLALELVVQPEDLQFVLSDGGKRVIPWASLTEIRIRTAAAGAELFWELREGETKPMVTIAGGGTEDNELMDGYCKRLKGIDFAAVNAAMVATTDASFLVWRKA